MRVFSKVSCAITVPTPCQLSTEGPVPFQLRGCEGSHSAGTGCVLTTIDDQSDAIHQLDTFKL